MSVAPEVKRRSGYDPHQPRDRHGRWVETGAEVRNSLTNILGTVTSIIKGDNFHENSYEVHTSTGDTQRWETSAVEVVKNPDGSAPTVNKPGTPEAHAEHNTPNAPAIPAQHAPSGTLDDAIAAVYLPPHGTVTATPPAPVASPATNPLLHAISVIDDERANLDVGSEEDLALMDLSHALEAARVNTGTQRAEMVAQAEYITNELGDSPAESAARTAVQDFLAAYNQGDLPDEPFPNPAAPGQESLLDENLSPVDTAIAAVYDPTPPPAKVKLSDGSALEGVQVTQLQPGDKIKQRKGTLYWNWVNRPKDENGIPTDNSHPTEGTVVSVADAGATQSGGFGSGYGMVEVTLEDGKVIRWNKTAKVDRVVAPVDVAVADVYDPPEGGGPKTPEVAALLTEAQKIAIVQKWKLPTGDVADLQAQLAAVEQKPTPTVTDLVDQGMDAVKATKEAKRLARNAQINAWRARTKLQAAIDTALAKDADKGPTPLQEATASGKLDKLDEIVDDPAKAPVEELLPHPLAPSEAPAPPSPADEAAATDAAANPDFQGLFTDTGGKPAALYTLTEAQTDSGKYGPGAVPNGHAWHDQYLASAGPNSDPIPVVGLHVQGGYKVENGWAQTIDGKAYLVETKPGETPEESAARMHQAAATLKVVMESAPPAHHNVQRGVAILNGANPQDEHWADVYGLDGFKSDAVGGNGTTVFFNGKQPDIATLAHEYGHNVDSNSHLSSQWLSTVSSPSLPGQQKSWGDARAADKQINQFYAGRFTETRPGNPIMLGSSGVTEYGYNSPKEDFAESVRLWLRDRRYGKVGYDPTTGDNIRFADLFPERAKILDARFGTKTDFDTAARKKRITEFKASLKQDTINAQDTGKQLPWEDINSPWAIDTVNAKFGLDNATANDVFSEAIKEFEAELEAENAKKAAVAAAKAKADAAKAAKLAAQQVTDFEDAYAKGLLDKSELDKLTGRRRARAYHLRKKGMSAEEADQQARAWEQAYIAEHWASTIAPPVDEPWTGKEMLPQITGKGAGKVGSKHIDSAGSYVHPLAEKQYGPPQQAKANIAAELASRLNNPDDWEALRAYRANLHIDMGGNAYAATLGGPGGPVKAYDEYTEAERQTILAKEVSTRVQAWAGTSGDTSQPAVVMQMAAKDEFGLTAHPAPRMGETDYNQWVETYYTPETQIFYRRFLRVMYENTQERLAADGLTSVKLYRGMKFYNGDTPDWAKADGKAKRPQLQPINSWSTKRTVAKGFSGGGYAGSVVFEASIPTELIIGTAHTGYGCHGEFEFVVMDADGLALANNYAGTYKYKPGTA